MGPNTREYFRLAKGSGGVSSVTPTLVNIPAGHSLLRTTGFIQPLKQDEAIWLKSYYAVAFSTNANVFLEAPAWIRMVDNIVSQTSVWEKPFSSNYPAQFGAAGANTNGQFFGSDGTLANATHILAYVEDEWFEADDFNAFLGGLTLVNPQIEAIFPLNNSGAVAAPVNFFETFRYEVWKKKASAAGGVPLGGTAYRRSLPDFRP